MKDKVVVFAHPLLPGSPNRMSQLMKMLNRKRQSMGQGVSISSYFKKIPPNTMSQNVSSLHSTVPESSMCYTDSSPQNSQEMDLLKEAPIEGHRSKIKNILKKGEVGFSRKHRKKNLNLRVEQLGEGASECIKTDETLVNDKHCQQDKQSLIIENVNENIPVIEKLDEFYGRDVEINEICKSEKSEEYSEKSLILGDVQISSVNINCDEVKHGNSIFITNKEQIIDYKTEKNWLQPKRGLCLTSVSDSGDEMLYKQSDVLSNSLDELLALPSTNTVTIETDQISNKPDMEIVDTNLQSCEADKDSDLVTDSPKFGRKNPEVETDIKSGCSSMKQLKDEGKIINLNEKVLKHEDLNSTLKKHNTVYKRKIKRKFPTFSSDSDSDTNLPLKKVKTNCEKFVNFENMKSSSTKKQLSKPFFSSSEGKAQPTISFFMSHNKKHSTRNQSVRDGVSVGIEDTDTVISPKVKNEIDSQLMNEIQTISSVGNLNEEQLQYLTRSNEKYLRAIFEGKASSERHQEFKKGGKSRRDLNYSSRLCQYSEEQVDTVMECLMAMFCKRHHKVNCIWITY
ncbi:uncharacterized protein LOC132712807 isoform X2 [Ruditapes philippinarum]|uniref:uncharacterized protein LOC132712807 isoform X2 n=1 Tax=Ruditapes philippinarum TaxID=129788 RepID=UPI00295BDEED|nr:uncharacterized protein LOC132712807 isoform X2 [Ruditapes philippinarum]